MKAQFLITFTIALLFNTNIVVSQEWKNLKTYQKETGKQNLEEGCWLKKDRLKHNQTWNDANLFNLSTDNGNSKYKTIQQIRDFYIWFDQETEKQGHEIKWIKTAGFVAGELSKVECFFIRSFIIRNKEVINFANEGSKEVFAFAFPQLKEVYFSNNFIKGTAAKNWDSIYGTKEQCVILEPLYQRLSSKALCKLDRITKGKGIFSFAISKNNRFKGDIKDCKSRFEYGMNILKN